jgi:hypothetical protein
MRGERARRAFDASVRAARSCLSKPITRRSRCRKQLSIVPPLTALTRPCSLSGGYKDILNSPALAHLPPFVRAIRRDSDVGLAPTGNLNCAKRGANGRAAKTGTVENIACSLPPERTLGTRRGLALQRKDVAQIESCELISTVALACYSLTC